LFTTQVSNDLGLLTRTLPAARELAQRGHQVAFCNSAAAPPRLISEAGFESLPQKHPLQYLTFLRVRAEDLRAKVRQVLDNSTYTNKARCLSEKLRAYGGAAEAARLIENLGAPHGSH
jgi:UDP:flavonoid glycosyltransferase YjiC (YdhE family)